MAYGITVHQVDETGYRVDLTWYGTASTAPEMEDTVTRLHSQFPAPGFVVDVELERSTR